MSTKASANSSFSPFVLTRVLAGSLIALLLWGVLLIAAPSPVHALGYLAALACGIAIVSYPRIGVYLTIFMLIGQWPYGAFRYLGLLSVVSSFAYLLIGGKRLVPYNPILVLVGMFVLAIVLSAIRPQTSVELNSLLLGYVANCALVWLMLTMIETRDQFLLLVKLMIFAGIVTAIIGLVQWRTHFVWPASTTAVALNYNVDTYRGMTGFDLQQWQGQFRIDSIVGTPDYLPLYMQTISPFVGFLLLRQKHWAMRVFYLLTILLFAAAHLLSYTRGAMITTAFVVVLMGFLLDRRRLFVYGPVLCVFLLVGLLSWAPWRERVRTMFDLKSNESAETVNTGAWRLQAVPVGIGLIAEHPLFGVGVGQGKYNWPENVIGTLIPDPKFSDPPPFHNDYVGVGVEMGLTGLCVLVMLLVVTLVIFARVSRSFRARGDTEMEDLATALFIGTAGICFAMLLYPLLANFRYVWLIFGFAAALWRYERRLNVVADGHQSLAYRPTLS